MEIYEKYGITTYCGSASSQNMSLTYTYLKKVLNHQTPKKIFIEPNCIFRDITDKEVKTSEKFLPIVKYHSNFRSLSFEDFILKFDYTWKDPLKGYRHSLVSNKVQYLSYMNYTPEIMKINKNSLYFLKK